MAAAAVASNPGLNVAALLASGTQVTPQIAVAAQMAALQAKTLAETGIAVPSYYNPSSVNPMKFAEQEKKRKKLWQGKKEGVRIFFYCIPSHEQALNGHNIFHLQFQTSFHTLERVLHYCCILIFFVFKDKSQTAELWEKLNFGNKDQNVKFRKLMGIKVSIMGDSQL